MTQSHRYTTQLQAGLGLVTETTALLRLWQPGMSAIELFRLALDSGEFPNVSARRLRNVVSECFAPRYLTNGAQPAQHLKLLSDVFSAGEMNQLYFWYTCRANRILADFVCEVYWERYAGGGDSVSYDDAKSFVQRAIDDGKTAKRWSDSTVKRVSSYLLGACADYGLLGKRDRAGRLISPYRIGSRVSAFIAHDLHFSGHGDNSIVTHEDWRLFGLQADDVKDELKRVALTGQIIVQSGGDAIHIGWKAKSMEAFVDGLTER